MGYLSKILTIERAVSLRADLKAAGLPVVMTNGCFDLLHPGHLRYLEEARNLGEYLIVALNDDASIARLKGPTRPINPQNDRAEALAALEMVNGVIFFSEDTPLNVIELIQPDILVKGGDYAPKDIVGGIETVQRGGVVRSLSLVQGYSTSKLIQRIRDLEGQ
ncbi:MAG: D-glycero-beta-D-manno-heptose 1-phosphate adenylyltransferase [Deltaproteobacteria bacterium]|jgi:D-beta-D-heptose 7-phosphate kinase/D-beta-D-heptose 1-phosphate adenosyltransferase|nr:D-glycero-beta-D-manno-heptose 1-phosphate adenylyltransferase [Deltaproteobacteria bacterium]